jgi:hypothetical protein
MELVANRPVVEGEVRRALTSQRGSKRNTVLLLRADPQWRDDPEFTMEADGRSVKVRVAACPTVLSVLAAMSAARADGAYLVVLTPVNEQEVGDSVLARAIQPAIKPINRWDLVQDAFGATRLDPALTRGKNAWVAEALLDAQPAGGWRRLAGTVLTRDTALNRLAATRLGIQDADDSPVDAAALLQWTTDAPAVASFLQLSDPERDGLADWLTETAGLVATVVLSMAASGKIPDAVPFGLAVAALYGAEADATIHVARGRAQERFLGGRELGAAALRAFGEAAESLVTRWADNGHAAQAAGLRGRAEAILAGLGGDDSPRSLASRSRVLDAGLDARFATLAEALRVALPRSASPAASPLAPLVAGERLVPVEDALRQIDEHGRSRDHATEIRAAESAVRLARWLAAPEKSPHTLADAATRMLRSWGWADRAVVALSRPGTYGGPSLAEAYGELCRLARARRAGLDASFAAKLASWTETGSASDLVCAENLLERIARPVAAQRLPVIVVLDGMSAAVATELAEEITGRGLWLEAGRREDGREPALATVPSVTAISRTSLLTGTLRSGSQAEERSGFAAFWGRIGSALSNNTHLAADPGNALSDQARIAILDTDSVVGVVLNAIDDTLDKGATTTRWTVEAVKYLGPVLDEARRAGRPVILTADHGHVLDRGQPIHPAKSDSARYRTGVPGPGSGEIAIRGERVLGGEVIAAVDEGIHYTPRKAGYHGGASAAEVVIPVITLLPSDTLLPPGWSLYDAVGHAPAWWTAAPVRESQPAAVAPPQARRKSPPAGPKRQAPAESAALFEAEEIIEVPAPTASLGAQVVASSRMASQRQFVRRAPDDAKIAALIDALVTSGGRLTLTEAAAAVAEPVVRMRSGYLAQLTRLLNVDSYPVLTLKDGGTMVDLNEQLLRQQFMVN